MTMAQQRFGFIDSAKGIGIVLVVFAHVIATHVVGAKLEEVITSFHMPIFFVLSGLFFSRKDTFKLFIINKTNRLLVPFFFFFVFYGILAICYYYYRGILSENIHKIVWGCYYEWVYIGGAIWFLLALWFDYLLFYFVTLVKNKWARLIICLIIGCVGLLLGYNHIELPFWIDTSMTCLPYFTLGYIIKNHSNLLERGEKDKYDILYVIVFIAIVVVTAGYTCYRKNHFGIPFWQLYICGVAGFFAVFFLAKSKIGNNSFLQYIGKYSLIILCIHQMIMTVMKGVLENFLHMKGTIAAIGNFVMTFAISCLLIPVLCKLLPHVTGQKNLF